MRVILFGATGMVGQGVLRKCVLDPGVAEVLAVTRSGMGSQPAKVSEMVHMDFFDFGPVEDKLRGYDACFFCLGVRPLACARRSTRGSPMT
jgi:nucleoside-diphosphate-sugar epimerase